MTRILVLSDTHLSDASRIPPVVLSLASTCGLVIHCGDIVSPAVIGELSTLCRVEYVLGNCDPHYDFPLATVRLILTVDGLRFGITHGDGCHGDPEKLLPVFHPTKVDVVLSGHTHVKRDFLEGGVRFINPGSVKRPRDGSSSVAIMETRGGVLYSEFLEL